MMCGSKINILVNIIFRSKTIIIYNNGSGIYTTGAHLQFTAASCFLNPQANTHCIVGVGRHAVREAVAIMRLLIGNNIGRHAVAEAFATSTIMRHSKLPLPMSSL